MPEQDAINRIMELQKSLPEEHSQQLNNLLSNAPRWLLESMQIITKKKHTVFIEENTPADTVYILVEGTVRAVDYRIRGIAYDYMWFYPIKVFGSMESYFHIDNYMTTLMTVTNCTLLAMTKKNFERWIWGDTHALKQEIASMGEYLLDQSRTGRVLLFLQGMDRILYLLAKNYEYERPADTLVMDISRQELSERSGFSIKTVNRSVKKMEEEGFIGRSGRRIVITKEQYKKMKEYLDPIVDPS